MPNSHLHKSLNEHTVEIRYTPNPAVLDLRGDLATSVKEHMSLTEWQIGENRVDVFSKDQTMRVFVSFRNMGAAIRNTPNKDFFSDQAIKFLRFAFERISIHSPFTQRLGVKSRFATPSEMTFDALLKLYRERILKLTPEAETAFDAKLIDIGGSLDFSTPYGRINSGSGPMAKEQLRTFFDFALAELPDVAFYEEYDYWIKPDKQVTLREVFDTVKLYASQNWERHERIQKLLES
jgi:hypothetical protein